MRIPTHTPRRRYGAGIYMHVVLLEFWHGFFGLQVLCTYVHVYGFAQLQVRVHICVHLHVCACIRTHLGAGMVQVCTCMASCWKLSMAAILPFAFEVGCEGFSGLQVLCALYWCMLTCTYRYATLHTAI